MGQLEEKIQSKTPIKELYEEVSSSQSFYFENLKKILNAAIMYSKHMDCWKKG